jgi:excisionase family DNA binding protein
MEGYVTVTEAAERIRRSIEQVRRYLREGKLAGRRIGQQWFIEEAALASWYPGRRATETMSVREPAAVYEARPMKTEETKTAKRLLSDDLIRRVEAVRERIRRESGEFDVVAMLRQDREEH